MIWSEHIWLQNVVDTSDAFAGCSNSYSYVYSSTTKRGTSEKPTSAHSGCVWNGGYQDATLYGQIDREHDDNPQFTRV